MSTTTTDRRLVALALVLLGTLLVLPVVAMGLWMLGIGPAMGGMWGGGMWGGTWGDGAPGWTFLVGALAWLSFLALVAATGYLVYRAVGRSDGEDRALEELRVAYARGDLTEEEYETRREALERDG